MNIKFASLLLIGPSIAFADINMKEASFTQKMNETSNPALARTYDSRSLWRGAFGFGWCAAFEKELRILDHERAIVQNCDHSLPVRTVRRGNLWFVQDSGHQEIYNLQGQLQTVAGSNLIYDSSGQLTQIRSRSGNWKISYQDHFIRRIQLRNFKPLVYSYNHENLVKVSGPQNHVKFTYDELHNLTEIRSAKKFVSISYDLTRDEVKSYQSSTIPCRWNFRFVHVSNFEMKSSAERRCLLHAPQIQFFTFQARPSNHGALQIFNVKVSGGFSGKQSLP